MTKRRTRGQTFREEFERDFELADSAAAAILEEACRLLDEIEILETRLADDGPIVEGSTGQPRANPLFDELRKHRITFANLVARLDPRADEIRSRKATRSVAARWGR